MRPIKFRIWDNVNKRMMFFEDLSWDDEYDTLFFLKGKLDVPVGDNLDIMQFTGICDKNGKEIYEGDILKTGYVIKWNQLECCFGLYQNDNYFMDLMATPYKDDGTLEENWCNNYEEVVGNIHEMEANDSSN